MLFLRNTPVDVLRYLPDFLAEDKSFKHVQDGLSKEHEQLRLRLAKMADQLFIPTAGEDGISSWERVIGLIPRADEGLEARRRAVLLWLQSNQVSTVEFMRRLAARYYPDDANVQIEEHNEEYYFRILAESFATDYRGLLDAMEIYKPAHLGMEIHSNIDASAAIYFGSVTGSYNVYTIAPAMAADTDLYAGVMLAAGVSKNAAYDVAPRKDANQDVASKFIIGAGFSVVRSIDVFQHRAGNEVIDTALKIGAGYILRKRIDVPPVIAQDAEDVSCVQIGAMNGYTKNVLVTPAVNTNSTVTVRYFQAGKSSSYKHQEIKEEK